MITKHPTTHGLIYNDMQIRTDMPTLGTIGRDAGYHSAHTAHGEKRVIEFRGQLFTREGTR